MNLTALANGCVAIAAVVLLTVGYVPQARSFSLLERDEILTEVANPSPNHYGTSFKLVISPNGFITGSIAPIDDSGNGPEHLQRALFISTRQDIMIHKIFLCGPGGCIDNVFSGGGLGPGPIYARESESGPDLYSFYNLDHVDWKEGDKVEVWAKVSGDISDSGYSQGEWVNMGALTVEHCIDKLWCKI